MRELIGRGSALIGLPTFAMQTYRQCLARSEPAPPTALWFFAMALIGTAGQLVYSAMVPNRVFLAVNTFLVVNNAIGLGIAVYRTRAASVPART